MSLPYRANRSIPGPFDPFEKVEGHSFTAPGSHPDSPTLVESLQNAWMTQSQRSKYFKAGGLVTFIVFTLIYLSGSWTGVPDVGSRYDLVEQKSMIDRIIRHIHSFYLANLKMHNIA